MAQAVWLRTVCKLGGRETNRRSKVKAARIRGWIAWGRKGWQLGVRRAGQVGMISLVVGLLSLLIGGIGLVLTWPSKPPDHVLTHRDLQTLEDTLTGRVVQQSQVADMANRLGIETTALQSMFNSLREDMPATDKLLGRLEQLVGDYQSMQQELKRLQSGPDIGVSLKRLRTVIGQNQNLILIMAHPSATLITGDINVVLYNAKTAELIYNARWASLGMTDQHNTVFHFLASRSGDPRDPKVTSLAVQTLDIDPMDLPPFAAANLARTAIAGYIESRLRKDNKSISAAFAVALKSLPIELTICNWLMYLANKQDDDQGIAPLASNQGNLSTLRPPNLLPIIQTPGSEPLGSLQVQSGGSTRNFWYSLTLNRQL